MIHSLLHALGLCHDRGRHAAATARSGAWKTVRKRHLEAHPTCAACGGKERLNVHHRHPFHLDPAKELDPNNLVTLCEARSHDCHLIFGHLLDFKSYNPHVLFDAARYRDRLEHRP